MARLTSVLPLLFALFSSTALAVETNAAIYASGACDSTPVYNGEYASGVCHNFPGGAGKYGAKFQDNDGCQYKVWANQGCTGRATVHTQNGQDCIAIANNNEGFYLTGGGASVSITCAS